MELEKHSLFKQVELIPPFLKSSLHSYFYMLYITHSLSLVNLQIYNVLLLSGIVRHMTIKLTLLIVQVSFSLFVS